MCILCFVLINSVLLKLLCVWIFHVSDALFSFVFYCSSKKKKKKRRSLYIILTKWQVFTCVCVFFIPVLGRSNTTRQHCKESQLSNVLKHYCCTPRIDSSPYYPTSRLVFFHPCWSFFTAETTSPSLTVCRVESNHAPPFSLPAACLICLHGLLQALLEKEQHASFWRSRLSISAMVLSVLVPEADSQQKVPESMWSWYVLRDVTI